MRTARARSPTPGGRAVVGSHGAARARVPDQLLGAQAGALYVAEPDGAYRRVGAIGVDAAATLPTAINVGEGLLGRASWKRRHCASMTCPRTTCASARAWAAASRTRC
jgi:hypothetical protein